MYKYVRELLKLVSPLLTFSRPPGISKYEILLQFCLEDGGFFFFLSLKDANYFKLQYSFCC